MRTVAGTTHHENACQDQEDAEQRQFDKEANSRDPFASAQRNDRAKGDAPDEEQGKRQFDKHISHHVAAKRKFASPNQKILSATIIITAAEPPIKSGTVIQ